MKKETLITLVFLASFLNLGYMSVSAQFFSKTPVFYIITGDSQKEDLKNITDLTGILDKKIKKKVNSIVIARLENGKDTILSTKEQYDYKDCIPDRHDQNMTMSRDEFINRYYKDHKSVVVYDYKNKSSPINNWVTFNNAISLKKLCK